MSMPVQLSIRSQPVQNLEERRTNFFRAWQDVWPELTITTEYSYLNVWTYLKLQVVHRVHGGGMLIILTSYGVKGEY